MKASELRIGNWISYNSGMNIVLGVQSPSPQKQPHLSDKYLVEINPPDSFFVPIDDIKPTELTPDILEKCGFEKEGDTYKVVDKNLDYCFRISFTGSGYFSPNTIAKHPILYLHQLQNLYWCLCGEELTITF